jgi:hypothetical protein
MRPVKTILTNGPVWYVPIKVKGDRFITHYLHSDGVIRFSAKNDETCQFTGHFATREKARAAIRLHKRLTTERRAEVFAHDGHGCIQFKITGPDGFSMTGSEPYNDRPFSTCLIAVGMVLQKFGVKDFKFHWKKPPA